LNNPDSWGLEGWSEGEREVEMKSEAPKGEILIYPIVDGHLGGVSVCG
jgi:hypothetical protein